MKKIKVGRLRLSMYDSLDELPIINFREYNRFVLIDAGIGSTVQSFDNHLATVAKLIQANRSKEAVKELLNTRQNVALVVSGTNLKMLSFVPWIHSINGERVIDLSQENGQLILNRLSHTGATVSWINRQLDAIKKKLT